MSKLGEIVSEARRRHVFRVVGLYIVGAWVVLQVSDLAFQSWGLPDEALRFVWVGALVLFPVALVFGWRYDVTAKGIIRTSAASGEEDLSLKAADYAILVTFIAVAIASGVLLGGKISETQPTDSVARVVDTDVDPFSIAVLPFATRSNVADTVFFADGIHDDLLTTLSKISALKVISRTSVLEYRDATRNVRQIGRELGAANILEGGVQQVGDNVRINVQLIDARSDEHLWAHTYDRELSIQNIFAIQSEIVETIASQLAATLSPEERTRISRDRTDNLEAFREFTRGKQQLARASFEALREAAEHFQAAIGMDPEYVLARAALADAYAIMALSGATTIEEMLAHGREHIDRAVALDKDNGYVQAVLGRYAVAAGDENAEDIFLRAIGLSPNDVDVLNIYSTHLRKERRSEEALVIIERALDLDPLSVTLYHDLGRTYLWLGRFEPAEKAFERISQINPENPYAAHGAALATILSGRLAEAGYWSDRAAAVDPLDYENPATSVFVYGSAGDMETARQRLADALTLGPQEPYPLAAQAFFLTLSGEREQAIAVARAALAKRLEDRWRSEYVFLRLIRDEALDTGNYDEALSWYRQLVPALFEDSPGIDSNNIGKAADLGLLLKVSGDKDRADILLDAVIEFYDDEYTLGSANFPLGIAKVDALALLGRDEHALRELRRLVDDGWRMMWRWDTELSRNLESLHDNVEFLSIIADIRADLDSQAKKFSAAAK